MLGELIRFIQKELRSQDAQEIIGTFLKEIDSPTKWILLTDYCLNDPNKANVITFVLLHYKSEAEYETLKKKILKLQKSDIKHTRYISNRLMRYLRRLPVFSCSFILDNRDRLFGDTKAEQQETVTDGLVSIRDCYQSWQCNANAVVTSHYQSVIKKLNAQIRDVSQGKAIELHEDILLTASLGALYTAEIVKAIPGLEIVGWFPDRDKITQSCNNIAIEIFHCLLYSFLGGKDVQVPVADPKITGTPFYDALNRIPDDICAAVADYDFQQPSISKEKFSHVLHVLMAGSPYVRVHRLKRVANSYHFSTLVYETTIWMSIMFYWQTMLREVTGFLKMVRNKFCRVFKL